MFGSERKPVTPSRRQIRTAALHQKLQAAGIIYPKEVLEMNSKEGNLPLRALEALDSIQLESGRHSATAAQIARRIDELYPPRQASEQTRSLTVMRVINSLKEGGYLTSRSVWGDSRRKLSATITTFYSRPKEQRPIAASSR
jgi:hypothetical protein